MASYRASSETPLLVARALKLARDTGFDASSTAETGRLLHVLAGQYHYGVVGEVGAGCGVGAAWMVDALQPGVSFITVELDPARAAATRELFAAYPQVRVLQGDWHALLDRGPFNLLFADGGRAKQLEPEALILAMRLGGLIVLDDLTPESAWPPEWQGQRDPLRDFWLNDPRLHATEIMLTPSSAVILATRVR